MYTSTVAIPVNQRQVEGEINIPDNARSLVIFSHGSGSGRFSPRNNMVARVLQKQNIGTFLLDLLTEAEDQDYSNRFNINLLTKRLILATEWVKQKEMFKDLALGYFGASTGAASALSAAAELGDNTIKAIVSRGGRPDLAMPALDKVTAPTLLIVGGFDAGVIEYNQQAFRQLKGEKELRIIPGATHLFEEPGKLERVAELAAGWYKLHLMQNQPVNI